MLQIHTTDINYNNIVPIYFGSYGFELGRIMTNLSQYRELDITINHNLNHSYNYLRSIPEAKIRVKINNYEIGFSKSVNKITHLLVLADTGQGTNENTTVGLDNFNNGYLILDYPLSLEDFVMINDKTYYYIQSADYESGTKKYYEIQVYSTQTDTTDNVEMLEATDINALQARIYRQGVNFLKQNAKRISIKQQINRLEGSSDIHFYSSILEIKREKRIVPLNKVYSGFALNLLNGLSPIKFKFISKQEDKVIQVQTGVYDNYDLLNKIVEATGWKWREIGLDKDNNTVVEVGDFDQLPTVASAYQISQDNWFKRPEVVITNVRELYPSLDIDLMPNIFLLEGSKIKIRVKENIQNIFRIPIDGFDINTEKIFIGFNNGVDLYNFL